mmetsp:Transcript_16717/g.46031  ORF Transcript_16717/g.46031 Transcript_16717/m.46031 type:complete len:262 (+) Transcript_16717:442-1227(+)
MALPRPLIIVPLRGVGGVIAVGEPCICLVSCIRVSPLLPSAAFPRRQQGRACMEGWVRRHLLKRHRSHFSVGAHEGRRWRWLVHHVGVGWVPRMGGKGASTRGCWGQSAHLTQQFPALWRHGQDLGHRHAFAGPCHTIRHTPRVQLRTHKVDSLRRVTVADDHVHHRLDGHKGPFHCQGWRQISCKELQQVRFPKVTPMVTVPVSSVCPLWWPNPPPPAFCSLSRSRPLLPPAGRPNTPWRVLLVSPFACSSQRLRHDRRG